MVPSYAKVFGDEKSSNSPVPEVSKVDKVYSIESTADFCYDPVCDDLPPAPLVVFTDNRNGAPCMPFVCLDIPRRRSVVGPTRTAAVSHFGRHGAST